MTDELKALKEVKSQMERDFEAKTSALTSSIVDLTKQKQNTEQAMKLLKKSHATQKLEHEGLFALAMCYVDINGHQPRALRDDQHHRRALRRHQSVPCKAPRTGALRAQHRALERAAHGQERRADGRRAQHARGEVRGAREDEVR